MARLLGSALGPMRFSLVSEIVPPARLSHRQAHGLPQRDAVELVILDGFLLGFRRFFRRNRVPPNLPFICHDYLLLCGSWQTLKRNSPFFQITFFTVIARNPQMTKQGTVLHPAKKSNFMRDCFTGQTRGVICRNKFAPSPVRNDVKYMN